ncbi:MBL fold metallo-hydrolase [Leifsonia sp. NPDC058248]|uniref:MBL fold metallo-hydrolase n=1 Tax=Leifsonia sp. NPDC058248 TaxID=3346402 RepID=UPI0036DDED5F
MFHLRHWVTEQRTELDPPFRRLDGDLDKYFPGVGVGIRLRCGRPEMQPDRPIGGARIQHQTGVGGCAELVERTADEVDVVDVPVDPVERERVVIERRECVKGERRRGVGGFDLTAASLAPGIRALKVAMPGGHIPYSLCYLIEDAHGDVHLVDPGWSSDENWASLERALAASGQRIDDVATIAVTHLHPTISGWRRVDRR